MSTDPVYTFEIVGDLEIQANFTRIRTVQWLDANGRVAESKEYLEDEAEPTTTVRPPKEADAQFTYEFSGWNLSRDTGTVRTYKPRYTSAPAMHTVRFVNQDGTELQSEQLAYGVTPAYKGATPTKAATTGHTYTFKGWDKAIAPVTGSVTYQATYNNAANEYTVTWVDEDGTTVLEKDTNVVYDTMPDYNGATPTKAATPEFTYKFNGWSPSVEPASGDVTYRATYSPTRKSYRVVFEDYDGIELARGDYEYGATPVYTGDSPERSSTAQKDFTFVGWDREIVPVTEDAVYTAAYVDTDRGYRVTWKNDDGTILRTDKSVPYGTVPSYDGEPSKEPAGGYTYTFEGWEPEIAAVTGDAAYTAAYTAQIGVLLPRRVGLDMDEGLG